MSGYPLAVLKGCNDFIEIKERYPEFMEFVVSEMTKLQEDKERWDCVEAQTGYTKRWVARASRDNPSRGFRLHNTSSEPNFATAREAVDNIGGK